MKYIALLRGINVGGNHKVPMSELRNIFEDFGFENVSTYINSGNIIFESEKDLGENDRKDIEKTLEEYFAFTIPTLILSGESLKSILREIPKDWENNPEQKTDIFFLWKKFHSQETLSLLQVNPEVDNIFYTHGAIVWHIEKKNYNKSGMNAIIGTEVYRNMTARNVNTVRKLGDILCEFS